MQELIELYLSTFTCFKVLKYKYRSTGNVLKDDMQRFFYQID